MSANEDRRKTVNGQLRSLRARMTLAQQRRRAFRIVARRDVADLLQAKQDATMQVVAAHHQLLKRGVVGRLKWLITGR